MKIKEVVLKLVKELTENDTITETQTLLDDGLLDSLTTIDLITKLEEDFHIDIDSDDLNHQNFNTVENIVSLINLKTSK